MGGGPYYNCSDMGPKTLFEFSRPGFLMMLKIVWLLLLGVGDEGLRFRCCKPLVFALSGFSAGVGV